jgi:tetratricopeptide (TPR) repeat protein
MRLRYLVLVPAVLVIVGCQAEKQPDPKVEATRQWNGARSSVMVGVAQDQYNTGNFDKCRQTVDEALNLSPDNASLRVLSARLYVEKGLLEAAERDLETARKTSPDDPESNYLSGIIFQRWQKPEIALAFYKTASTRAPAEAAYLLAQAEMLVALDRNDDALLLLTSKVDYFENSGVIRDEVGQLLYQAGRSEEAIAMLRQASLLSGGDLGVKERLALALYGHREFRECSELLEALVQQEPCSKRADLFTMLGECQLQTACARQARSSFETASELDPASAPVWRGLGQAALECGDAVRAEHALLRSIQLDGTASETHLLLGYVFLCQERFAESLGCFESASAQDLKDGVSICMQGYVLQKMGRREDAVACYTRALQVKPDDKMASELMARVELHD